MIDWSRGASVLIAHSRTDSPSVLGREPVVAVDMAAITTMRRKKRKRTTG
jgi:hypothetical protein